MKKYIFITPDIHMIGGAQNYLRTKISYLIAHDWSVYCLFPGERGGACEYPELEGYTDGGIPLLRVFPDLLYPTPMFLYVIQRMLETVNYSEDVEAEYLIESNTGEGALWGELLAKLLNTKHFVYTLSERFCFAQYKDYIDFFYWKFLRRELIGISKHSMSLLFDGYADSESFHRFYLPAAIRPNVYECSSEKISLIKEADWNIAYLGRCEKTYFRHIINDVKRFSDQYADKKTQFIIAGNPDVDTKNKLQEIESQNLIVIIVGFFSEIPRELFSKFDVVIAGSGCAAIAASEGIPTIVADAIAGSAMGIYGIHTKDIFYSFDRHYTYKELLKSILIDRCIDSVKDVTRYVFQNTDTLCDEYFRFVKESEQRKNYYPFLRRYGLVKKMYNLWDYLRDCMEEIRVNQSFKKICIKKICCNSHHVAMYGFGRCGRMFLDVLKSNTFFMDVIEKEEKCVDAVYVQAISSFQLKAYQWIVIATTYEQEKIKESLMEHGFRGEIIYIQDFLNDCMEVYYDGKNKNRVLL